MLVMGLLQIEAHDQRIFLDVLRQARRAAGLRQQDLADRLGVPQSFVSKVEAGSRRLDLLELRRICVVLDLTLTEFSHLLEEALARRA
ncbi:MAG TPA: helix-turn-helix transcriptional regulator [Armatimonadota bacterium]